MPFTRPLGPTTAAPKAVAKSTKPKVTVVTSAQPETIVFAKVAKGNQEKDSSCSGDKTAEQKKRTTTSTSSEYQFGFAGCLVVMI